MQSLYTVYVRSVYKILCVHVYILHSHIFSYCILSWVELCLSKEILKTETSVPQNVTLFRNKVFGRYIQTRMRSSEQALFQYDWRPYKMGKFGLWDRHARRGDHMKTQEDHRLQGKECLRLQKAMERNGNLLWQFLAGTNLTNTCFWAFSLPNYETTNFCNVCCLTHPVWGILFDCKKTNTHTYMLMLMELQQNLKVYLGRWGFM